MNSVQEPVTEYDWDTCKHPELSLPLVGERELTRYRSTFVRERANLANRVQKVLESANIKLASVASDVLGLSGRAMLNALMEGKATPSEMAELAKGRMREKHEDLNKALAGRVKPHHRFVLAELLHQIDNLDETPVRFDERSRNTVALLSKP